MAIEGTTGLAGAAGAAGAGTAVDSGAPLGLAYRGTGGDLFLLVLKNLFLTLVTLGIYAAWARTARRRYTWRQVHIGDHPLDYTGTGKELFMGYLKVAVAYLVLVAIPLGVTRVSLGAGRVLQALSAITILIVLPFAVYWSRRYLLGRTRWRGIRFGLGGEAGAFAKLWIKGTLLTIVTLGIYGPILANRIYGALMRNTRYGTVSFAYDGPDREAFWMGIKGFFMSIVTLGIYSFWYSADVQRFRLSHTHFDRASGRIDVTGGLLFKLTLINLFGNALTLGLAFPWTISYTLRVILSRMSLVGPIDFGQVMQRAASGDAAGDSLASALGVEIGI